MAQPAPETTKQLTTKEQRFVEEYCVDFNATQAAIRAGYSRKSAKEIGYENLTKPHIQQAVSARLAQMELGAAETTKLIADIAKGSLNDFFEIKEEEYTPRVKKGLGELIQEALAEIDFEDEYATRAQLEEDELQHHQAKQKHRRLKVLRMQLELERNPAAYRYVDGPTVTRQVAELNLVELVKAKESGRIKAVKHSEHGLNVELYPADAALRDIARIHGLFKDRMDITTGGETLNGPDLSGLTDEELAQYIALQEKVTQKNNQ